MAAGYLGRHWDRGNSGGLAMTTLREFFAVYRLYRRHHPMAYAIKRAWHIAVQGSPF